MMRRALAVALVSLLAASPAVHAATPLGADTPQGVVERLNKAAKAKDFVEIAACLDPESRTQMAGAMLLGTTMMIAFMGMGSEMAGGMAEGMAEATGGSKEEAKAKTAAGKAEMDKKMAKTKADFSAVLKKHGLPDLLDEKAMEKAGDPKALLAKADQPALIGDLMKVMQGLGDEKEGPKDPAEKLPDTRQVTDYKITGDTATAKSGTETIKFMKADGRWFLIPPEKPKDK